MARSLEAFFPFNVTNVHTANCSLVEQRQTCFMSPYITLPFSFNKGHIGLEAACRIFKEGFITRGDLIDTSSAYIPHSLFTLSLSLCFISTS